MLHTLFPSRSIFLSFKKKKSFVARKSSEIGKKFQQLSSGYILLLVKTKSELFPHPLWGDVK